MPDKTEVNTIRDVVELAANEVLSNDPGNAVHVMRLLGVEVTVHQD